MQCSTIMVWYGMACHAVQCCALLDVLPQYRAQWALSAAFVQVVTEAFMRHAMPHIGCVGSVLSLRRSETQCNNPHCYMYDRRDGGGCQTHTVHCWWGHPTVTVCCSAAASLPGNDYLDRTSRTESSQRIGMRYTRRPHQ